MLLPVRREPRNKFLMDKSDFLWFVENLNILVVCFYKYSQDISSVELSVKIFVFDSTIELLHLVLRLSADNYTYAFLIFVLPLTCPYL
jgi:uncharacterized membrane protein YpjA